MDNFEDKRCTYVAELISTKDDLESGKYEKNQRTYASDASGGFPIHGHYFELPDLLKSFDPDPPPLDSSLPYIPVYTHLKTFDLAPIERPNTPPMVDELRSGGSMRSKNRSKSRSTAVMTGRNDEAGYQADQTIMNDSGNIRKYEDRKKRLRDEST